MRVISCQRGFTRSKATMIAAPFTPPPDTQVSRAQVKDKLKLLKGEDGRFAKKG
jgi:hypothetical protein